MGEVRENCTDITVDMSEMSARFFKFEKNFRERLVLSICSNKKISISCMRKNAKNSGLRKFEVELLSIIDKLVPESLIEINESGTVINFSPGKCVTSKIFHKILTFRGISYYTEFIIYILLVNPYKTEIKISGLRALNLDVSLENILYVTIPLVRKIGTQDLRLKIFSNFFSLLNNTELILLSSNFYAKKKFHMIDPGILRKVRIIFTFSSKKCALESHNEELNDRLLKFSEVTQKFYNLHIPNKNICFQSVSLIGETSTGCLYGTDYSSMVKKSNGFWNRKTVQLLNFLLEYMNTRSCIDGENQAFVLFNMLNSKNSSKNMVNIFKLTINSVQLLRDVKNLIGITFSIRFNQEKNSLIIHKN